jgi:uncharacterized Tic20 family protein
MSVTDEIAKLNELKESGAITEEEFDTAKAELLQKMSVESQPAEKSNMMDDENTWGMFIHLSQLTAIVSGGLGYILPIVLWQIKKDKSANIDAHGKNATNWIISAFIYGVVSGILCFVLIGFLMAAVLGVLCIVFPIIAGLKAKDGIVWQYPMAIKFFK